MSSILRINAKELVNSTAFVREPVEKEVRGILSSSSKRIILTGGNGVGKSTVLCSLEQGGHYSNEKTIYTSPDISPLFSKEPNEIFKSSDFDCLYGMLFANDILHYIKDSYPLMFSKHFKEEMDKVQSSIGNIMRELNNRPIRDSAIEFNCETEKIIRGILTRFREITEIDKLNIAIDRFDRMRGSSECAQKSYEGYFNLFDRVVITSDDPNLDRNRLLEKGYDLRSVSYGNDRDALREIIIRRKPLCDGKETFDAALSTSDLFLDKLTNVGGNIDLALDAILETRKSLEIAHIMAPLLRYLGQEECCDEGKILDEVIENEKAKRLNEYRTKPTLYL